MAAVGPATPTSPASTCSSAPTSTSRSRTGRIADDMRIRSSLPNTGLQLLLGNHRAEQVPRLRLTSGRPKTDEDRGKVLARSRVLNAHRSCCPTTASSCSRTRASTPADPKNDPASPTHSSPRDPTSTSTTPSAQRISRARLDRRSREAAAGLRGAAALSGSSRCSASCSATSSGRSPSPSGGAKVEDKLGVLKEPRPGAPTRNSHRREDGGGSCVSRARSSSRSSCRRTMSSPLPAFEPDARMKVVPYDALPGMRPARALTSAPRPDATSPSRICCSRTVFWNGPMGVFEWPRFAEGTRAVGAGGRRGAGATPSSAAQTPSVRCARQGLADAVDWVSPDRRRGGPPPRVPRGEGTSRSWR